MTTCSFCGLPVFLNGAELHPCCQQAQERGEATCGGCTGLAKRSAVPPMERSYVQRPRERGVPEANLIDDGDVWIVGDEFRLRRGGEWVAL